MENHNQKKAAVSVIMGVHNTTEKTILEHAVMSILNQTFSDFEFIICDDGSTDETYAYLEELMTIDERIILLKNPVNMGLAASLNKCMEAANGKYIARMDADDICKRERFEKQYTFLEEHAEYAMVGSKTELIDQSGVWGRRQVKERPEVQDMLFNSPFIHPSIMVRKEVYQALNGYRVSKETYRMEDYDLFMRMYAKGYKGYNMQQYLFQLREDRNAYKRKKYRYRLDEARVRYQNFKLLHLMPKGYVYVVKPLLVGLIPISILKKIRKENVI